MLIYTLIRLYTTHLYAYTLHTYTQKLYTYNYENIFIVINLFKKLFKKYKYTHFQVNLASIYTTDKC